ncbi:MAG: hypothetical protein KAS32_04210 [Candidatus Peribacteraceae bacterium]|nr:hypothetical protein [Candidatus Peribacteraceae bacterium]
MNEKIKEHLNKYCIKQGWGELESDGDILETLQGVDVIYTGVTEEHRHWDDVFTVVEIDGMLIGYDNAHTTGDLTPNETGWEFDLNSVCEVEKETKTITIYKPKKEAK